jgi:hypothetical protein
MDDIWAGRNANDVLGVLIAMAIRGHDLAERTTSPPTSRTAPA